MQPASKENFVLHFETTGPEEFCQRLVEYAITKSLHSGKNISPEMELLNYYNQFLQIYRRENKPIYRDIALSFRRAAHKVYRKLMKKKLTKQSNKFLYLVE